MIQPVLRTLGALVLAVSLMATANAAESDTVASDDALPYLNLDFENNQGWIATVKGGYQWKLFRNVGVDMVSGGQNVFSRERNFTKPGGAASIGLGYNFGERFPVTVGVVFGIGPSGKLDQYGTATVGTDTYDVFTRQKISVYTLDASIDYDFKNCSRWTPFVGAIVGVGFMKDRGHSTFTSADGTRYTGEYGKKNRTNFVVGGRLGTKYKINERLTLSLYGSYTYMGKVPHREYDIDLPNAATVDARTKRAGTHALDLKVGLKVKF
ncbi:MAG: hypothetical protein LIQ30_09650 [Planctomycetes bacterium]|nr:hypothetical protein [Planctomycetota bacterium]MCC8115575.1 hypothetical protein [Planctomycetota bacterium]